MKLRFSKMHGLGNDFMVIDGVTQAVKLDPATIQRWGDRHFGVGFDQLLLVEKTDPMVADFRYRIFNCDGSEVEQCGNGARCFVRFVHEQKLTEKREIAVETAKGVIYPRLEDDGRATVNMGAPRFAPAEIPFIAETDAVLHELEVGGTTHRITVVSMGNPHAVQVVADVDTALVAEQGPLIEHHPRFPQRVNAGFMQIVARDQIRLRVFERGAGETMACGTGACAAVVAGIRRGLLDERVKVSTRGGELIICWAGGNTPVWMTGPAETVYEGVITL